MTLESAKSVNSKCPKIAVNIYTLLWIGLYYGSKTVSWSRVPAATDSHFCHFGLAKFQNKLDRAPVGPTNRFLYVFIPIPHLHPYVCGLTCMWTFCQSPSKPCEFWLAPPPIFGSIGRCFYIWRRKPTCWLFDNPLLDPHSFMDVEGEFRFCE